MSCGYEHMDLMVFPRTLQGSRGYEGQRHGRSPILLSEPILEIHWNLFWLFSPSGSTSLAGKCEVTRLLKCSPWTQKTQVVAILLTTNPIKISSNLCRWPGQNDNKLGKLLGQKMVNKIWLLCSHALELFWWRILQYLCWWCCTSYAIWFPGSCTMSKIATWCTEDIGLNQP
jgi:hypothetical protein